MLIRTWHLLVGMLYLASAATLADVTISEGTNITIDVAGNGSVVTDLVGGLWLVPAEGGDAERLPDQPHPARNPRFSADGERVAYVAEQGQATELWVYDLASRSTLPVAAELPSYEHPDWHPAGDRIAFAADRDGDGLAIWEVDVATGLTWRLTHGGGDATWPAYSEDGRDLAYVRHLGDRYELVLRRLGAPDEVLLESEVPLSAPSFRPDKSLVTVLVHRREGIAVDMVILSSPRLRRTLLTDDDIFVGRVAWRDRETLVYAAGGHIRTRQFDAWTPETVPFAARVEPTGPGEMGNISRRRLEPVVETGNRLVVRAGRLFDGLQATYRRDADIIIENGKIAAIEDAAPRPGEQLIDLGGVTIMPGLIDVYAALPPRLDPGTGARLLSFGVTAIVTTHHSAADLDRQWASASTPGPRVLPAAALSADMTFDATLAVQSRPWLLLLRGDRETGEAFVAAAGGWQEAGVPVLADNWQVGLAAGARLVLGGRALPVSPAGRRYADQRVADGAAGVTIVSALAHAGTRNLDSLFAQRQARGLGDWQTQVRRYASPARLAPGRGPVVLGSAPSGLPPGIAQHAELRALVEAGLGPFEALRAATVDAASALGLGLTLGRIATGAEANFLLIQGDPLASIDDAAKLVGVVQNGRFVSLSRLLDNVDAN
jgi:hypothetical protein